MTLSTTNLTPLVVFVDVDDTLIRSAGTKRIAITSVAQHVSSLYAEGATLFCWSSGGANYARTIAEELGIANCFAGFLPKPNVIIDDQEIDKWRRLKQIHPGRCSAMSVEKYWQLVNKTPIT
ncbi:MAG: hypothetical protein ACKVP0_16580 [Pirellulaceae bacterium]